MAVIGTELARNRVINPTGYLTDPNSRIIRRNLATNPSVEDDAVGWSAVASTGGAVAGARVVGTPYWTGLAHYRATWSAASTAVSGGVQYAGPTGLGVPVAAGVPYSVSCYVQPSKNQRLQISVAWYTSADALISTSTATAVVAVNGFNTRLQITATAPANATKARVRVLAVTGTGGVNWATNDWLAADSLLFEQTTKVLDYFDSTYAYYGTPAADVDGTSILQDDVATLRTNLAWNPSAEVDATSNCTSYGTGGMTATQDTTRAISGTKAFKIVRVGTNGSAGYGWRLFLESAAPGDVFTYSAYFWSTAARSIETYVALTYIDRSTTDQAVDPSATEPPGIHVTKALTAGAWTRVDFTFTVPAGGLPVDQITMGFMLPTADASLSPIWVDGVLIERGSILGAYFDGSTPADGLELHKWGQTPTNNATPGLIFSRRVAPMPSGYSPSGGAVFYRRGDGGIGVIGSSILASARDSGVYTQTGATSGHTYTVIAKVLAVDACTLELCNDVAAAATQALAAGATVELRTTQVAALVGGSYTVTPRVEQKDSTPKRWTVLGFAVIDDANYTGPYFDGSTPAPDSNHRYVWDGPAYSSMSVWELLPAPTLTVTPDQALRSAELLATGVATVEQISIRRITPGYETALVRSAQAATAIGGQLYAYDHEPPLGLASSYQAMAFYSDGSTSGWSDPVSFTNGCDPNEVWVKDVGQPLRSMKLILRDLSPRRRAARTERHDIQGSKRIIAVSDVRSGGAEVVILGTRSHAEKDQLDELLDSGQAMLMQVPPEWGRRDQFCSFGDSQEARLRQYGPHQYRDWQIDVDEVEPPSGDRTGLPTNSYSVVASTFATYADLLAARPTYLSMLAGTAAIQ